MNLVIGADIGGSHISCVAVDLDNESILKNTLTEISVNNKAATDEILFSWSKAIKNIFTICGKENINGIGIAMPGPFNYEKGIALFERVEKFENLYGVNVANEIKIILNLNEDFPIRFMNDATSFAVGEAWFGSGKKSERIIALTLGTGFGSAFINQKTPVLDGPGIPELGCLWHLPFKDGIADDFISTRWFVSEFKQQTGIKVSGAKEIARHKDYSSISKKIFQEYGQNLAVNLAPWIEKFNPNEIIIGGNLTGAYDLFKDEFENQLKKISPDINVELSKLKESAAMIGAAILLNPVFWNKVKPLLSKM